MKYIHRGNTIHELGIAVAILLFIILIATTSTPSAKHSITKSEEYWPSSQCRSCHVNILEQHSQSMHAKSFTNPVFQAQYFKELLPQVDIDASLVKEAESCIACHAPIAYIIGKRHIVSKEEVDPFMSGVTCDFCHTIKGYKDESPGNGNYISVPGNQKLGPFMYKSPLPWHHVYSELHTKSEFCAICHNQVNHYGLEIKSTFTEWKNSPYAKEGIQCQDCHMNVQGFLTAGKPVYESGRAAYTSLAYLPYRSKLYTHRFPGAHSRTQVVGALTLSIEVKEQTALAGEEMTIHVLVDNSKTGHKMPSGSIELRLIWLELKAYIISDITMRTIPITASSDFEGQTAYNVTGNEAFDQEVLKDDIPKGNRIYRAIFVDKTGKQTLSSYNAIKIIFDNRLNAAEIRKEPYLFKIPEDAEDKLFLFATLYYLPYPPSFAKRLGLPEPEVVEIASTKKYIILKKNSNKQ